MGGLVADLKKDLKGCFMNTSLKGVPRVFKARKNFISCFWILAVLVFLTIGLYQSVTLIKSYLKFSTVTLIHDLSISDAIRHPDKNLSSRALAAVTLCNRKAVPTRQHLTDVWTYDAYKHFTHSLLSQREFQDMNLSAEMFFYSPNSYYRSVPIQNLTDIGYLLDQFLVQCFYKLSEADGGNIVPCKELANFQVFTDPNYLNCFTIKLKYGLPVKRVPVEMTGILYLDNIFDDDILNDTMLSDWYTGISAGGISYGAYVIFHPTDEMPDVTNALAISPGFESHLNAKQTLRVRLGSPWGHCQNPETRYQDFHGREYAYSLEACLKKCALDIIVANCSCLEPETGIVNAAMGLASIEGIPLCGALSRDTTSLALSRQQFNCQRQSAAQYRHDCLEQCPSKCRQAETDAIISQLRWPQAKFHLQLYEEAIKGRSFEHHFKEYKEISEQLKAGQISPSEALTALRKLDLIQENLAKFVISSNNAPMNVIEDRKKMTMSELISQLGGILNLFSGITVILIVEALELLCNLVLTCIQRSKEKEKKMTTENVEIA